jgi:hypothetical protein
LKTHDKLLKQKQARKKWYDVAYLKGYLYGYTFVIADENIRQCIPHYFDLSMNEGFDTFKEYKKSLTTTQRKRKSVSAYASEFVKQYPHPDIIVHHTPFL